MLLGLGYCCLRQVQRPQIDSLAESNDENISAMQFLAPDLLDRILLAQKPLQRVGLPDAEVCRKTALSLMQKVQ
jgi:hypothetical protein